MVLSMHENWTLSAGFGYVDAEWDDGTFVSPVISSTSREGRRPTP